jgi:type IV secretory pathway TrbF-like protein
MKYDPKAITYSTGVHEGTYERRAETSAERWSSVAIVTIREPLRDEQDVDFDPYALYIRQSSIGDGGD